MKDAILDKKVLKLVKGILKLVRGIFPSTIKLKLSKFAIKLCFHQQLEFDKTLIRIRLVKKWINPSIPKEVIHKEDVIFIATYRRDWCSPQVNVNQFKDGSRYMI